MDRVEITLQQLGVLLSRLLDPLAGALDRLGLWIRLRLEAAGVPHGWHTTLVTLLWALVLFMAVRSLSGWLRLVAVVLTALVLAKVHGVLPGA